MKAQILKIAGVKSEKEFYKKYPSEEVFMKQHGKAFKKAQMGTMLGGAKYGANISRAQVGWNGAGSTNYQQPFFGPNQQPVPVGGNLQPAGLTKLPQQPGPSAALPTAQQLQGSSSQGGGLSDSKIASMAGPIGDIYNAFQSQNKQAKVLEQQNKLLGITETLSKSTDVNAPYQKHVNDRPEKYIASTNSFYPAKGTGYDILRGVGRDGGYIKAQNGSMVGGNPIEIQNTYDPYDIYSDGGYEPMNDSNKVKSFQMGGGIGNSISGQASGLIGEEFNNSAGFQAGNTLGQYSDLIVPGSSKFVQPILGAIGGGLDQAFGSAGDINYFTKKNKGIEGRIMDNSMWKNTGYLANRQEGGYLNPEYNPQVITMFGDHDAEDFADYAHKYRAGGHLKEYTTPSERAMETYAEGGELKTHWGGEVEPVSYNPYSEGEGLTYNAYGNSHFQKDQQGRTGIGLSIMKDGGDMGDEPDVEIETNEPISMTGDGAVVYGNLNTNKDLLEQFQLPEKYANRKVKHIVNNMIVPKEQKYTKELERITSDVPDDNTAIGALGDKTREIKTLGLNMKLKKLAQDKENLAAYQDHIHKSTDFLTNLLGKEVSQEKFAKNGEVSHILAKGEISQKAKNGKTLHKAAYGTTTDETTIPIGNVKSTEAMETVPSGQHAKGKYYGNVTDESYAQLQKNNPWFEWDKFDPSKKGEVKRFQKEFNLASKLTGSKARLTEDDLLGQQTASAKVNLNNGEPVAATVTPPAATTTPATTTKIEPVEETKKGAPWLSAATSLIRGFQPAFNMPIGSQINPELYSIADNNVEGLSEHDMYSMLETPYKYSADRDRNAILSQARQAVKNAGHNPAAQAAIMAQVADSMGQVSSREGDINQQGYQGVYNRNINTVNQDRARNLGLDIDSAMKLSQAKSNLQAKKLAAMTSAEAKIAANKRENMEYNIGMAEHPDFTFGPDGRIIKLPRYVDFDTSGKGVSGKGTKGGLAKGKDFSYDDEGNIIGVHSKEKEEKSRNGKTIKKKNLNSNIVKAFKGL